MQHLPHMRNSNALLISLLTFVFCCSTTRATGPAVESAVPLYSIVVQNYYYALPGKSDEVYALRIHASDVRAELGLPRGRVLRRTYAHGEAKQTPPLPDVIWEAEYPTRAAREADVAALAQSQEFRRVEQRMDTLLQNFQRALFEVDTLEKATDSKIRKQNQ